MIFEVRTRAATTAHGTYFITQFRGRYRATRVHGACCHQTEVLADDVTQAEAERACIARDQAVSTGELHAAAE